MGKNSKDNLNQLSDQEYLKQQLKEIKKAKKRGDNARAERLAADLYQWLGWTDY